MITGVTRKAIVELFRTFDPDPLGLDALFSFSGPRPKGIRWWGDLDEVEFLGRLYDLEKLPSTDDRYENALQDIWQHRNNNDDWPNEYIFTDPRFELNTSDRALLKFLTETLHPEVRTDREEVGRIRAQLNDLLRPDRYQLQQVDVISGVPVLGAVSIEPRKVTALMLREAIAEAIWAKGPSAPNLPSYCNSLGVSPSDNELDPMASKRMYVKDRTKDMNRAELLKLARLVIEDCPDDSLIDLVNEVDAGSKGGQGGRPKNLIFAANGLKPEIVLSDSVDNEIKITKNEKFCLVYAEDIDPNQGLSWDDLLKWWSKGRSFKDDNEANHELYKRLFISCNDVEKLILNAYGFVLKERGFHLPALIPQVYLHFDPLTFKQRGAPSPLVRQRMDFLLLMPNRYRVVIELDGIEHYTNTDGKPDPKRYAEMMEEDRRLRLAGYEVYRFGGAEFIDKEVAKEKLKKFFEELLDRYKI